MDAVEAWDCDAKAETIDYAIGWWRGTRGRFSG
jgi:hypothetical protein